MVGNEASNTLPQITACSDSIRIGALVVVGIILLILFEVYRTDFENWIQPATHWLTVNDSWSWTIPTVILIILSFPPLFGHEIVMLFVGVRGDIRNLGPRDSIAKILRSLRTL